MTAILFDTETTGMLPRKPGDAPAEVIELAWVELAPGTFERVENICCERFKPLGPITYGAMATHGIISSDLTYCPPSSEAALPSAVYLIGHNVDFDWEVMGKPVGKRICTLAMARRIWPDLDSHKLTALFYFIHGANDLTRDVVKNAHSALHDVAMTHQIFLHMINKMDLKTFEDIYQFSEQARIPTHWGFGKFKGELIEDADKGYVAWYRRQPDTDPYVLKALAKHFPLGR